MTPIAPMAGAAGIVVLTVLCTGAVLNLRWLIRWGRHPGRALRAFKRLRRRPWDGANAAGILAQAAVLYAAASLAGWALQASGIAPRHPLTTAIMMTALLHLGILVVVLAGLRRRHLTWREAFGRPRSWWHEGRVAGAGYAAMLPSIVALTLLVHAALRALNMTPRPQAVIALISGETTPVWLRILLAATAVLTAPLAEELIFRGILLPVMLKAWNCATAILLSSLLFAALHGNATAFLPLTAAAAAFAAGYAITGSIWTPILMHAIFNGASLALLLAAGGFTA